MVRCDFRQVDPWDSRSSVVVAVPVMVEPQGIQPRSCLEIAGTTYDISVSAEVMDILQRRPQHTEASQ